MPQHAVPAEELRRYSPKRDPHSEADIARYVETEARGELVKHVEKIKEELVAGEAYEIWDVVTDKDRWWVITNLTNLYSQRHFPSLDYTISFHIGLMLRIASRPGVPLVMIRRPSTTCLGAKSRQRIDSTPRLSRRTTRPWGCSCESV